MICPRKNDSGYNNLVEKLGVADAYQAFTTSGTLSTSDSIRPRIDELTRQIQETGNLYFQKYGHLLPAHYNVDDRSLAIFLANYEQLNGHLPINVALPVYSPDRALQMTLESLSYTFGVPFTVINDPGSDVKGYYENGPNGKQVVINVAKATKDTPFHEFYHAPVRILKDNNPELYNNLIKQAEKMTAKAVDEEGLVDLLGKLAVRKSPSSLLQKFFAYLKSILFGPTKLETISASTTLSEFVDLLRKEYKIDVSGESTISRAYQIDGVSKAVENKFQDAVKKVDTDYINELKKLSENLITDDLSNHYKDKDGKVIGARLTPFVGDRELGVFSTRFKNKEVPSYEDKAKRLFVRAGLSPTDKIVINNGALALSLDDYAKYLEAQDMRNRIIGKMQHAYIAYLTETDKGVAQQRKEEAIAYADALGEAYEQIDNHPFISTIAKDFPKLMSIAGINAFDDKIEKDLKDRVAPEITIKSNLVTDQSGLNLITTADGLIQHYNNELSLIDYKTGDITSDIDINVLMQYGKEFGITDSKINKAYLELAFRALIIKENFPDARFRNIRVVRIDNKDGRHKAYDVDLAPYLGMIGAYYKANNKEVFNKLNDLNLLDETTYIGVQSPIIKYKKVLEPLSLSDRLLWVDSKLAELTLNKSKEALEADSSELKAQRAALAELRLELTKIPGTNLKGQFDDIDRFFGQLKNMSDIEHAGFQTFHKALIEAKASAKHEFESYTSKEEELLKEVLKEVGEEVGKPSLMRKILKGASFSTFVLGAATGNPLILGGSVLFNIIAHRLNKSPKDVFAFLWAESTDEFNPGYFLNTNDHYFVDGRKIFLTKAQIEYRDYISSSMREIWEKSMNKLSHYDRYGRPVTKAQALGYPAALPFDFMPRIPKPVDEIRLEESAFQGFLGAKTRIKNYATRTLTRFVEDNYYSEDKGGIPVKYYKHSGSTGVQAGMFSFNAHEAYRNFIGNLINKDNLDPMYTLGEGLKNIVELEKDEAGRLKYPNFAKFIDNQIFLQILNRPKEVQVTKTLLTIPPNKFIGNENDLKINQDKVLRALKGGVSFSVMAFKMVSAAANTALITITNTMNATKQPLAAILGIPPEELDITTKGATKAYGAYSLHLASVMQGKESKLMNLAKKFDWLPDNYDYFNRKEDLLFDITSKGLGHYGYLFHNFAESYGGLVHLGMLLNSIKVNIDGKQTTLWDAYNDKGEWTKGSRGKVEIAPGEFKDLTELDSLEIKNLKRAYEKLHGSYRKEERSQIEVSVIGEFLLQFKKFFYTYMKNLYASPFNDITTGKYVLDESIKRPDGVPVWKWESEVMQGRINVLMGGVIASSMTDKITLGLTNKEYYGEKGNRTKQQTQRLKRVVELANTGVWMILMYSIYALAIDDDEEETAYAFRLRRLVEDTSMGLNPKDLLSTIEKPVVAADRVARLGKAFMDFATADETKDGRRKGTRQIISNIPIASNVQQLVDIFTSKKHVDQGMFFGLVPLERNDTTR